MPQGCCFVRMTLVLSLAGEKLLQGGANMTAIRFVFLLSCLSFCLTAGIVRSLSGP